MNRADVDYIFDYLETKVEFEDTLEFIKSVKKYYETKDKITTNQFKSLVDIMETYVKFDKIREDCVINFDTCGGVKNKNQSICL